MVGVQNKFQVKALLERISSLNILVIGDIMLDHYIWGEVYRISPEAPVPVVAIERDSYRLGGAANVALNLRKLGAKVSILGWLGNDLAGKEVARLFGGEQILLHNDCLLPTFPTILKTRVIARNQQLCRLDRDTLFHEDLSAQMLRNVVDLLPTVDGIILSDYAKGTITQTLIDFLSTQKEKHGFFWAMDPKPHRRLLYRSPDLLTPNRMEALQLAGFPWHDSDPFHPEQVVDKILEAHRPKHLAITLGKQGMLMVNNLGKSQTFPTLAKEVFDVSGAGDTVVAALTAAFCAKADLEISAHFANLAAGIVVGKIGTATATPEEILAYECLS